MPNQPATSPRYSSAILAAAREWIMDCSWTDLDQDDVDHLPDSVIIRGIERHYSGGMAQLIKDSLLDCDCPSCAIFGR